MSSSDHLSTTPSASCGGSGWAGFGVHVAEAIGGGCVVRTAGELDRSTAALMRDALSLAWVRPGDRLIVDASGLTFMSVAGLRVLLAAHERLVSDGGPGIVVRGASGIVRTLLELTGSTALLDEAEPLALPSRAIAAGGGHALELARRDAGLSISDLFVAYFALGGDGDRGELVAYLNGDSQALDVHQQDIVVHAVNEHLSDLGRGDQLLSYASADSDELGVFA